MRRKTGQGEAAMVVPELGVQAPQIGCLGLASLSLTPAIPESLGLGWCLLLCVVIRLIAIDPPAWRDPL